MFYEETKIKSVLKCKKCNEMLDVPRMLPCGSNLCSSCVSLIQEVNEKFDCLVCTKTHNMSKEEIPINEALSNLLLFEPNEISRGDVAKNLRFQLDLIQENIDYFTFNIENGVDKIKEHCYNVRAQVQLATEKLIQEINQANERLISKVDKYEKECIREFESKKKEKTEFNSMTNTLRAFHNEWIDYFKQTKLSDKLMQEAIVNATSLNEKSSISKLNLEDIIFNGRGLKFQKNNSTYGDEIIGQLSVPESGLDSAILNQDQKKILMELCGFSVNEWQLIYRGSRDGFTANSFHSKCNGKSKTLVIIKSNYNYIFGGYTEQDWNGNQVYKNDPKAFIFSIVNSSNIPQKYLNNSQQTAIYCDLTCGPIFGNASKYDINVNVNFAASQQITNNQSSYSIPSNFYLGGNPNYTITEIEVFSKGLI